MTQFPRVGGGDKSSTIKRFSDIALAASDVRNKEDLQWHFQICERHKKIYFTLLRSHSDY